MAKRDNTRRATKSAPAEPPPWHERFRSSPLLCLLLAVVTFAVYVPALRNDFVNYDDSDYVTSNPHVQSGLKWENVQWAFTTGHASNWHPITWLSHMLDCQWFGLNSGAHHLVNIVFHTINVVLLFLFLRFTTSAIWRSAFVAAMFTAWVVLLHIPRVVVRLDDPHEWATLFVALAFSGSAWIFAGRQR